MPSSLVSESEKKKQKVYYSARGGSRSKGADSTARANNAKLPSPTALETPLPRSTTTHFSRGGEGNEWNYVVEDGVLQRALIHDQLRLQELRWKSYNPRLAKTGLRGGAAIPKLKSPKTKVKTARFSIFRKRKGSSTSDTLTTINSPTTSVTGEDSLERRLYELSLASSDDGQSIAFSDFTAPSYLFVAEEEDPGDESDVTESGVLDQSQARARSFSLSSATSEDSIGTPEPSPERLGRFSFRSPGILIFKPDEAQPFSFNAASADESSPLELNPDQSVPV